MFQRISVEVYRLFSAKHLDRYIEEYERCRSLRELDETDQMS